MNLFDLKNNPLFLQCWRERNRFSAVTSAVTLVSIIVIILFLNAYLNDTYIHNYVPKGNSFESQKILLPWFNKVLLDLSILQGIVLLLFGCINGYRMAARERVSGTIDFHRCSPTPRSHQIVGLVFGATSLEWWIFLCLFGVELCLAAFMGISILAVIQFNFQLALAAILYHALFCLIGISRHPQKNKASTFGLIFGIYFFGQLYVANNMSFLHQLTWFPAFKQLNIHIKGIDFVDSWTYYRRHFRDLLYMFYGIKLNPIFFQCLVQIPFISLFLEGIGRRFQNLDQPIFSKSQTLMTSFYLLILFTGSFTSNLVMGIDKYWGVHPHIYILIYFILTLGIFGGILATPTQLGYIRGLKRIKKLHLKKINTADNNASNFPWLLVFCFIVCVIMSFYYILFKVAPIRALLGTLLLLMHIIFFTSFFEYFRLSRHHNKQSIFWTIIIIFWVLIPIFGVVMDQILKESIVHIFFIAPSPFFFGGLVPIAKLFGNDFTDKYLLTLYISLSVSGIMALIAALLAYVERQRLKQKHL